MFRAGLILAFAAVPALAGEYAVLPSGLRLHADRHERSGEIVRLYDKDGVTELPASAIMAFEQEDYIAPPPPVPVQKEEQAAMPPDSKVDVPKVLVNQERGPEGPDSRRGSA